ncbi:MAG: tetratricopeptide repeat protein [Bacteroidales bacterium]|nr:tetratricopeptide repeat protein [Bacteroidales bacterium]
MKTIINILIFLSLFFQSAFSANIDTIFSKANQEYSNELYTNAIEDYNLIIQNGYESAELYFNLGNAYFKTNDIPSAILYYEKAKKLNPNDEDISFNLNVANTRIVDKIEPVPELFLKQWWRSIYNIFNANTWAIASVAGFILFFVLLAFYLLSKYIVIRKSAFYSGLIVLLITLFTFTVSLQKYNLLKHQKEAIVFIPTITVKSSPNQNSVDLFVIHEGSKVRILEKVGNWYEIKIASGSVGWLPAEALKDI